MSPRPHPQAGPIRILYIEGDRKALSVFETVLSETELDWRLACVATNKQAFDRLDRESFDLLVVSNVINENADLRILGDIRQVDPLLPISVCTEGQNPKSQLAAMRDGANSFLNKQDMDPGTLECAIRYALRNADHIRQLAKANRALGDQVVDQAAQLAESEAFNELLVQSTPAGMIVVKAQSGDVGFTVESFNKRIEGRFDLSVHQFKDEPLAKLLSEIGFKKDDVERLCGSGLIDDLECEFAKPDGELVSYRISRTLVRKPFPGSSDHNGVFLITLQDTTVARRRDVEIRRFASMLMAQPNPIVEIDESGRVALCNEAALGLVEQQEECDQYEFLVGASAILSRASRGKFGSEIREVPLSCLLYTSPSPRDRTRSRMPSSA